MSGFAVMFDRDSEQGPGGEFESLLQCVQEYKGLRVPPARISKGHVHAAKLDSRGSLHPGVTVDDATGSWLIAAGTVVDTQQVLPDGALSLLLQDYLVHGLTVFSRLDGVFALVVWDNRNRKLSIVSDPFGYFSVFYGERGSRTFIATSALAVARQIQSAPSKLGVHSFLRTGKVFDDTTLWRDVKRVRAATVLEFGDGGLRESTYWTPKVDSALSKLSLADAVDTAAQVLPDILKRNLSREGKVWSDLTGGYDTRLLVMLLERAGLPFKANFVGPRTHPDVVIAEEIVKRMNLEHQHFELPGNWPKEAPRYLKEAVQRGDGHLNALLLLRPLWVHYQERGQLTTLLSGLGGEMWRGINWWSERAALGKSTLVHYERQLWSVMHPVPNEVFARESEPFVQAELRRLFAQEGERCPEAPNTFKLDRVWTFRETAHTGAWTSFAAGLLRVVPALFSKDIISLVMSLDYRWRVHNSLVKHMLYKYRPVLADLEVEGRGPALPLRLDNWYRFIPSQLSWSRKALNKLGQVTLQKSLWPANRPTGYSELEWRREIQRFADTENIFRPSSMRSGALYHPEQLEFFLAQAQTEEFKHDEFLGRIITVELALRETDAEINDALMEG